MDTATTVAFLLFPKTHLQDLAGAAQVFYEAAQMDRGSFKIRFISPFGTVHSEQGLPFGPLEVPESLSLKKDDMVCVPGFDFRAFRAGELDAGIALTHHWMWAQREKGVYIASICSGALALAKMGLLNHVKCTCHWKCLPYIRQHFPLARLLGDRLYVFDRNTFTSAGMTTGIDMALALVERWRSPLLAARVAQEMVVHLRRDGARVQKNVFLDFENHFNAEVYQVQEMLANRLDARFTLADLAQQMNRSSRHLARLFKSHTGQTIQAYRDGLRLEHGEQLLLHTEMSVKEVAAACGFENARQFLRLWQRGKGCSPGQFRRVAGAARTGENKT